MGIGWGSARAPGARVAMAIVLALAALAGCAGDDAADGADDATVVDATTDTTDSTSVDTTAPPVEVFTGTLDEFYEVPDPLPPAPPGTVIRTMPVRPADGSDAPSDERALRIMYHSTDADGDDRAVTGVVAFPTTDPPDGGWPVVAWAHGTTGMAPGCAPSRQSGLPPAFGVEGVRVATDYLGLGPPDELHPYLSAAAEGHAVIDSVAAVRSLAEVNAGDRWVVTGHSQGGHAVLVTNERAAERLPDAELLGAVAVAPGSQLGETYGDDVQVDIITTMVLFGEAFEDPTIDPADYLTPEAFDAAEPAITGACLGEVINALLPFAAAGELWETEPSTGALGEAWVAENDPGSVAVDSPLLVVQGGRDAIVLPARTDALFERLCEVGQVVEQLDYPDADHDTVIPAARAAIEAWVAARFAGEPATDECPTNQP